MIGGTGRAHGPGASRFHVLVLSLILSASVGEPSGLIVMDLGNRASCVLLGESSSDPLQEPLREGE